MALLLEEIVEQLLKLIRKTQQDQQSYVDPTLDPVLLIPGIAGSILHAVDEKTGKKERVWVRILGADHEFREKLWSRFDPTTEPFFPAAVDINGVSERLLETGSTLTLADGTHIEVPEDRHGLYAIDTLDPDMVIGSDCVYYFHDMIVELLKCGYQEGTTLFGFGYDFRQSNRFQETMERLASKLESVYTASGGKKITIISHSMGGLLTKCFMSQHTDLFEKYVKSWIAIAAPFRGAPGYITSAFLNGCSFVDGWEQNFFISKWSMQQLLLECPSIYELMACLDFEWEHTPLLEFWRKKHDSNGDSTVMLESYNPVEAIPIINEALSINKVKVGGNEIPVPFNMEILKWANETRELMGSAKVPDQIKFYNIYGTNYDTPHSLCYGSESTPISDLQELPTLLAKYIRVDGDGTVPVESAKADGLRAEARVGVPGDHRGILCDRHVFRIVRHWLKADHDPFYNPINDYVILPTAFDVETFKTKDVEVTSLREEWEIVGEDQETENEKPLVGSITVSRVGGDKALQEEAHATVTIQPQANGKKHVELNAVSVSASA